MARRWLISSFGVLLGALSTQAFALDVKVTDAWVRQSLHGEKVTSAFVSLQVDEKSELIAASSDVSKSALLARVSRHSSGFVTNRIIHKIPLTPEKINVLANGGYHIMLMNLKPSGVHSGQKVLIRLKIKGSKGEIIEREVTAPVRGLIAR